MTSRPRRLQPAARAVTIEWLRALADELEAPHADAVQALLVVAADPTGPATASGAAPSGGTGPSTSSPVERAAARPDPVSTRAQALLDDLHDIGDRARRCCFGLIEVAPNRAIAMCPYGHPLTSKSSRCTWTDPDTGASCGTRAETVRVCVDCGAEHGKSGVVIRPWKVRGGQAVDVCNTDWMFRYRNGGRPRVSVQRLARDAAELVAADGTYTEPEVVI